MPPSTSSEPRNTVQAASIGDMALRSKRTKGHSAQERIKAISTGSAIRLSFSRVYTTAETSTTTTRAERSSGSPSAMAPSPRPPTSNG